MKKKILIFGAGSIGNHFANASLKKNYEVFVTDIDNSALKRMKEKIFPLRYKKWNNKIHLIDYKHIFKSSLYFNFIVVGTPPETHLSLANKIFKSIKFEKILIEKPLCSFNQNFTDFQIINKNNIYCGYNHSVSKSILYFLKLIKNNKKKLNFLSVSWNEGWDGILKAHFWLKSEYDSYLGNFKRGGGALQEHSHGLHLTILIIELFSKLEKFKITKIINFNKKSKLSYDNYALIDFFSKRIRSVYNTDLISNKSNKNAVIIGDNLKIQWIHNYKKSFDAVIYNSGNKKITKLFKKNRADEFITELSHIERSNKKNYKFSNIKLDNAIKTVKIIKNCFKDEI